LFTIRALDGLTIEGEEKDIVWEIWRRNRRRGQDAGNGSGERVEEEQLEDDEGRRMERERWTNSFLRQDLCTQGCQILTYTMTPLSPDTLADGKP
jgi:hypothetical protein